LRLEALQATQKAIEDPSRCYSVGVIAAITASIFEAVGTLNTPAHRKFWLIWNQHARGDDMQSFLHLCGLRTIINHRQGGLASLRTHPKLWMLISM
jgi:hypothetical protein